MWNKLYHSERIPGLTEIPINEPDEIIDRSHVTCTADRVRAIVIRLIVLSQHVISVSAFVFTCDNRTSHQTIDQSHLRYERTRGSIKLTRAAMNEVTSAVTAAQ